MQQDKKEYILFKNLFDFLVKEKLIHFPSKSQTKQWEKVLKEWIDDQSIPLFARKGSSIRGQSIEHDHSRKVIKTDNTPAHWVFRNFVLNNEKPFLSRIKDEWETKTFPIAIMIKKSEKKFLVKSQIASHEFRLGYDNIYVAHIEPVALSRSKIIPYKEFINHHIRFLSLGNMYCISKDYSGLSHIKKFNEIVIQNKPNSL